MNTNQIETLEKLIKNLFSICPPKYTDNGIDAMDDGYILSELFYSLNTMNTENMEEMRDHGEIITYMDPCWTDFCYTWSYRRQALNYDQWLYAIDKLLKRALAVIKTTGVPLL